MSLFRTGSAPLSPILALLLLAGPGVPAASAADRPATEKPNIIFIMADDLGYGHLGCYGQEKIRTPNLDRLAKQGMRFTAAYAGESVCAPSRSTLMTGQHNGHTPIRANGSGMYLADRDVTVAEVLKKAGYTTGAFGKWGLGNTGTRGHPNEQGFDQFWGQLHQVHAHFYYPYWIQHNRERYMLPGNEGPSRAQYVHDVIHERAKRFIINNHDEPFFAYLPYIIPHVELVVPDESEKPYRDEFPRVAMPDPRKERGYLGSDHGYATYAGMISRLDRHVGQIMDLLAELRIAENTLVIFTSDNGPQGRHAWDKLVKFFDGNGKFRGDKGDLYEGGIRVPMIARWPGQIEPGTVTDHPCYFPDVMPTLADLAGVEAPENIDGISFLPTLLGKKGQQPKHEVMYWAHCGRSGPPRSQAVRMGRWKAVQPRRNASVELYNLNKDPGETNNVADEHPQVYERIKKTMDQAWTERRGFDLDAVLDPTTSDYKR